MKIFLSIVFISLSVVQRGCSLEGNISFLVKEYFTRKHIYYFNIFTCSRQETVHLLKQLQRSKIEEANVYLMAKYPGASNISEWFWKAMKAVEGYKFGIYLNMSCDFTDEILRMSSSEYLTNQTYEWLVWSEDYYQAIEKFEEMNLALNSQFSLVASGAQLYDVHKINYTTPLIVTHIGNWSNNNFTKLISVKKNNLQGLQLKTIVVLSKLQVDETNIIERATNRSLNITEDGITRCYFVIYLNLKDMLNFTMRLRLTDNWGHYDKSTGHFTGGIFAGLETKDTDLSFTPAEHLKSRRKVSDFGPTMINVRTCLIFRHPQIFSGYTALLKPLTPSAWLVLGLAIFLSIAVLIVTSYFNQPDSEGDSLSWSSEILLVLGIISQQGLSVSSTRTPKRIIHISLLVLSMITYGFYGAAIVIFLLSPTPKTIDTVDKIIDSHIPLGAEDTPYNRFYLMNASHPNMAKLYQERIRGKRPEDDHFYEITEGVEKAKMSRFAFFSIDTSMYKVIDKIFSDSEKCLLAEIEPFPSFEISIPIRKRLPFKEIITRGLIKLLESGVPVREKRLWMSSKPQCLGQEEVLSVRVGSLTAAYAIFAFGIVLSLVILAFEKISSLRSIRKSLSRIPKNISKFR